MFKVYPSAHTKHQATSFFLQEVQDAVSQFWTHLPEVRVNPLLQDVQLVLCTLQLVVPENVSQAFLVEFQLFSSTHSVHVVLPEAQLKQLGILVQLELVHEPLAWRT